jgi:glycosyltransferase involved in cell wall biosynthesis
MHSLRILIVTHAPISPEFGAAQMAINLAGAFREQGHDVTLWSPHPLPTRTKWWQKLQPWWQGQQIQVKLEAFLKEQEPFDIIDAPGGAGVITQQVSKSACVVVARSVQPHILYILSNLNYPKTISFKEIARSLFDYFSLLFSIFFTLQDYTKATYILCLGSLELQWMKRWFPWWKYKLISYVNALSKTDSRALSEIRKHRQNLSKDRICFLWIGRWVAHKGITQLLDFILKWLALHPQDTFTIAGCGTNAEKDVPIELVRSGSVKVIPAFTRNELEQLLVNHDIGLFTSKVEGWGLVLNEMLESGMPVYATLAGGVPDLKPFFQDMLVSFPPSKQATIKNFTDSTILENYYKIFSWEKIAETYINTIFAKQKPA